MDPLAVAAVNYGTVQDWLAGIGTVGTLALDLTVDGPHALVRVGPQQLVGGRPAWCSASICHSRYQGPVATARGLTHILHRLVDLMASLRGG